MKYLTQVVEWCIDFIMAVDKTYSDNWSGYVFVRIMLCIVIIPSILVVLFKWII